MLVMTVAAWTHDSYFHSVKSITINSQAFGFLGYEMGGHEHRVIHIRTETLFVHGQRAGRNASEF